MELCREDFARLAGVFQSVAQLTDPVERLKQIGRTYIRFGMQYPNHYKLMFMTPHPPHDMAEEDCEKHGNPELDAYAFLKATVQQVIDGGYLKPGLTDAELVSQTMWAGVHGVISLNIAKCNDAWVEWRPIEARAELMLEATLRGILAEGK
jgi:hypothetical protein